MSGLLVASTLVIAVALTWSLMMWRRLRDWRLGLLVAFFFSMTLHLVLKLVEESQSWSLMALGRLSELPEFAVSVLGLLGLMQFERFLIGRKHSEQALRRSERDLAEAQRLAHLGNWDLDLQTDEVHWSDEVYRTFGVQPSEFEGTVEGFFDLVHPEDHEVVREAMRRTVEEDAPYDIVFRCVRRDGSERVVHALAELTRAPDGTPLRLFGTGQDITDLAKAQEALKESEAKYRTLFEHSPVGVGVTSLQGDILAFNDALLEPGGFSREDVERAANVAEFYFDPADRAEVIAALESGGMVRQHEVRMKAKDGSPYYVWLSVAPVTVDQKPCLLTIAEDVTDLKQAEEAYRVSNELQHLVVSQIDEIVYSVSFRPGQLLDGELDFVSPKLEEILGYTPKDFDDDPHLWLNSIHPDDLLGFKRTTEEIFRRRTPGAREYRFRDKRTGAYRWIEDRIVPRVDNQGQVVGVFGASRDVTRRRQAEEELRRSREALRRLAMREQAVREEERKSIAREMHDELGQALTAIRMDLAWLREKSVGSTETVRSRTESMIEMVDQTADLVRDMSSRLRPAVLDDLGLSAAIEWQVQDFRRRTGTACSLDTPPLGVDVDMDRATGVFRILQEALTNVARHAEASRVGVTVKADGGELLLRVHDDGKGISEAAISATDSFGLQGMRERAHALQGSVIIEPSPDGGTTVTARMPW